MPAWLDLIGDIIHEFEYAQRAYYDWQGDAPKHLWLNDVQEWSGYQIIQGTRVRFKPAMTEEERRQQKTALQRKYAAVRAPKHFCTKCQAPLPAKVGKPAKLCVVCKAPNAATAIVAAAFGAC